MRSSPAGSHWRIVLSRDAENSDHGSSPDVVATDDTVSARTYIHRTTWATVSEKDPWHLGVRPWSGRAILQRVRRQADWSYLAKTRIGCCVWVGVSVCLYLYVYVGEFDNKILIKVNDEKKTDTKKYQGNTLYLYRLENRALWHAIHHPSTVAAQSTASSSCHQRNRIRRDGG